MQEGVTEYTVVINGKPEGPYQLEELKELKIRTGTFIRTPGMDDYKEAHEFPELRELLGLLTRKLHRNTLHPLTKGCWHQ